MLALVAALFAVLLWAPPVAAEALGAEVKRALEGEKHIYVATRRPDGTWSRPAPVWFMYDGDAVFFTTAPTSHKARRIRGGSPVRVRVGTPEGPAFDGSAAIVSDPATVERMGEAYRKKYWIAWFGFFRPRVSRVAAGKTVAVRIVPAATRR
jgi:PPOX class probable F420-dependent enzyme